MNKFKMQRMKKKKMIKRQPKIVKNKRMKCKQKLRI